MTTRLHALWKRKGVDGQEIETWHELVRFSVTLFVRVESSADFNMNYKRAHRVDHRSTVIRSLQSLSLIDYSL